MDCRATSLTQRVKITRRSGDFEPTTVVDFFKQTAENFPAHYALASRSDNGSWHRMTYCEYQQRVEKIAKVFIKLGLEQRGVVAILSWNRPEWVIAALGAIHCGGVVTGIYTTNSSQACHHVLESSSARILVVEGIEELRKINEIAVDLPHLKHIILLKPLTLAHVENAVLDWQELLTIDTEDVDEEYRRRLQSIAPNECCALIYTSGTSGFPKAAMLSHDNLIWNARTSVETMACAEAGNEAVVSYLPLSHAAAFMSDIFIAIHAAATVYFVDVATLKNSLVQTLQAIQPTIFIGVPRVFEKIEEKLSEKIEEFGTVKRRLFAWTQAVNLQHHFATQTSIFNALKQQLATRLVTAKVKDALGFRRCKLFITGSAPMSDKTKRFLISLDMPAYEAYGMTESSTVHTLTNREIQRFSLETVGKCLEGAETKICTSDDSTEGEICIRGRHVFMGYLNDAEKTEEAIDSEGWLHTGDSGRIDEMRQLLFVTGRLKEILITSGGENIPAVRIENLVKLECAAISNALLVGDGRRFLSLLLTLKTEVDENGAPLDALSDETLKWLRSIGSSCTKLSEIVASKDEKLQNAVQAVIDRVNAGAIANPQRIQKFAILPRDFSVVTGELTPTMKVKRYLVVEKYRDLIEEFYRQ